MKSSVIVAQHPLHPMLISVPVTGFLLSLGGDLAYLNHRKPFWFSFSTWTMRAGTVGALVAAVPGLIDYATIVRGEARRPATWHLLLNLSLVGLFGTNLMLRRMPSARRGPLLAASVALTVIGNLGLLVSAWYGGELVYKHRIGVQEKGEAPPEKLRVTLMPEAEVPSAVEEPYGI